MSEKSKGWKSTFFLKQQFGFYIYYITSVLTIITDYARQKINIKNLNIDYKNILSFRDYILTFLELNLFPFGKLARKAFFPFPSTGPC